MVESGKSFIKRIQEQGAGGIFGGQSFSFVKDTAGEENPNLINNLGNTDSQATVQDKPITQKAAEKIVNSKIGQKLIGVANTLGGAPEKGNLGAFSETFERGKERAEQNLAEKKEFYDKNIYEDTAKFEKVAGINEQGEQNIKSQARKEYEAMGFLGGARLGTKKVEDMFPEYWTTIDGQKEYRTDGQYVVNRPVGYTPDLLETMQDAYNSVTYAYAQDGVVLTPDDLKKAYPEYANVSDGTLANFISGCMFDVQNGKRSDIKIVGDAMGAMAMTEGYTNRMDGYLDILSDETILKHGFDRRMANNKEGEQDMILAGQYLKWMVNEIRATGSFAEGLSDWAILSAYRKLQSEDPEVQELVNDIDKYMTLLEEQEAHDGVQVLVTNIYHNYKDEMSSLKDDIESEDFLAFDTIREVLKEQAPILIGDMRNVMQEMRDQSEEEGWYPLKNVFENLLLGKYYRDNDGNYYEENLLGKGELAYSRREDGTYIDSEGNIYSADEAGEINKQGFIGRLSTGVVGALTSILTSTVEGATDLERMISSGNINQYGHAVAYDIIQGYFAGIMANPQVQYMFAIPGVGDLASNVLGFGIDTIGEAYLGLLQEFGISDGWSLETKDKAQEAGGALGMIFASKAVKGLKDKIKSDPRLRAIAFALKSYLGKLDKVLKIKNKKGLAKLIEEGNKKLEQEKLERQKNRIEQQQKSDTTLAQDVRAGEKSDKIIEKETEKKKETAKEELEGKNTIPLFKLLQSEMAKAKEEFFDEFYEEYKKQAGGEENMDQAVLLEKDLRDMEDPEKKQQLIDKYKEIFGEELLEKNAKEWENFGKEIMELRQEVMSSLKEQTEATEPKTTKDVLEEEKLPGRKPTKRYEKIEEEKLDLPGETRESLRENPFRYILKDILKDFIEPLNKKGEVVDWDSKDIVKYKRKKNISRVEVQERIMEKWKEMAQQYMNKLKENQKKIFDFKKDFFDTDIDYDIKNFFTEFLKNTKVNNKLSELFKKGILSLEEVYDENGNLTLEVVYNGEQRIPSTEVRETMELFNDIIKELQKYWKDDKLLLDEASLYELRNMMKEGGYNIKGKEKAGTFADRAQDLYAIFNDYLDTYKDTTGIGKDIRPYDHAFSDYFELVDLLDKFFNGEGEIKKESRNRLINIAEKAGEKLNLLDKLIPGTKEMLKLMESGHDFITKMVTFMEATNYKTWFGKRVLKYGPMMLTALALKGFLPLRLSAILAIPVGETIGEKVRNLLGRKRPSIKDIEEIFKQLDLTEEEIKILEEKRPKEFEKTLSDLDAHFDEALKEILGDYEKGRQTEEGPRAYDRQGNEVRWVDEDGKPIEPESKGGPDDTTPTTPPTPKGPENSPKNPPKNDGEEGMEKEISDIEDEGIMEELDLMENTSNKLQGLLEDMVKNAETKKDAKLILAAAGLKITNTMLALRDSPRVKAAKKDAQRIMQMDKGYELLKSKIDKTEGEVQLVYVNALYKLMLAGKAPTSMITIDYDYVADKKNIKDSADYSTEGQNKANWEMNKEIPTGFGYGPDYDNAIADIVKKMIKNGKREVKDEWITDNATQFLEGMNAKDAWNKVEEDAYTAYDKVTKNNKTTTREQARNIKIKEAEGKRIEEEVGELMDPEDIKKREDLWFSFDKEVKAKNKTRRDNQGATIVNKDKVDYIDGGLTRGTIMISWGAKDGITRVMVNNLETLSNFPQVEKSIPENAIIIDASTGKEYSLADVQRMDIKGETNTKTFEEYYKKQMEEYPEEIQDIFNEKDQVVSSEEGKSEAGETKAEEDMTVDEKMEKMSNKELVNQLYTRWDDEYYAQGREIQARKTEYADNPNKLISDMKEAIKDETLTQAEVQFYVDAAYRTVAERDIPRDLESDIINTRKELEAKGRELFIENKPVQKPTKSASKNKEQILDAMKNPNKYLSDNDKKKESKYLGIARIYEYYNGLPKELQDLVMESWLNNEYIKGNSNLYSNVGKLEEALKDGIRKNKYYLKKYKYDDETIGRTIPSYSGKAITDKGEITTKKDVDKISNAIKDWSNVLNINIPRALKEGGEGKGEISPVFRKKPKEEGDAGYHYPKSRDITFLNSQLAALHEVAHDITQSLFFNKHPEEAERFMTTTNKKERQEIDDMFGKEYVKDFNPEDMNHWNSFKNKPKKRAYYTRPTEIISRAVEMYLAEQKGIDFAHYDKYRGYWDKETYDTKIKQIAEEWMKDAREMFGESSDITVDKMIDKLVEEGYFDDIPEIDEMGNIIEEQGMSLSDALMQDPRGPLEKVQEAYLKLKEVLETRETEGFNIKEIEGRKDVLYKAWVEKLKPND